MFCAVKVREAQITLISDVTSHVFPSYFDLIFTQIVGPLGSTGPTFQHIFMYSQYLHLSQPTAGMQLTT